MKNKKTEAANFGSKNKNFFLRNQNNKNSNFGQLQTAPESAKNLRDLLAECRLSQFPKRGKSPPMVKSLATIDCIFCVNCKIELTDDNQPLKVPVCRKCLAVYSKIEAAVYGSAKTKARDALHF